MGFALDGTGRLPASVLPPILSTWPSGTPAAGQEFVYYTGTAASGASTYWTFKYDPANQATYRWACIGGVPVYHAVDTSQTTTSTTFADLTTVGPTITVPRAGVYLCRGVARMVNNTANAYVVIGFKVGSGTPSDLGVLRNTAVSQPEATISIQDYVTAAAGDVIKIQYRVADGGGGAGTGTFLFRRLDILPVVVS